MAVMCGLLRMCRLAHVLLRKRLVTKGRKLLRRMALLLLSVALCAALLNLGGCGLSVQPKGQVVTGVSVGH